MANGGVGLMLRVAREVGLVEALDRRVQLLKMHVPFHESDHGTWFVVFAGHDSHNDIRSAQKKLIEVNL